MNDLITTPASMTSIEIAELVNSRHDSVKRTVETLVAKGVIAQPQSVDEQSTDSMGRTRITKTYLFTGAQGKRDSIVVVAQLSPLSPAVIDEAIIAYLSARPESLAQTARLADRWRELEQVQNPVAWQQAPSR